MTFLMKTEKDFQICKPNLDCCTLYPDAHCKCYEKDIFNLIIILFCSGHIYVFLMMFLKKLFVCLYLVQRHVKLLPLLVFLVLFKIKSDMKTTWKLKYLLRDIKTKKNWHV